MITKANRAVWSQLEEAAKFLERRGFADKKLGIILGSGLGRLADRIENPLIVDTGEIPGYPVSSVEGHQGRIIAGGLNDTQVLVFKGRVHFYEGYSALESCAPVVVSKMLGIESLIITNAAGSINPGFRPGELMLIRDILRFNYINPLRGLVDQAVRGGLNVIDPVLHEPYLLLAQEAAVESEITLHCGTYAGVQGPTYETPAETRMLTVAGADAVGMSTVPEIVMAKKLEMKLTAISCLTNYASSISSRPLTHEEVQRVANSVSDKFIKMMTILVGKIKEMHKW